MGCDVARWDACTSVMLHVCILLIRCPLPTHHRVSPYCTPLYCSALLLLFALLPPYHGSLLLIFEPQPNHPEDRSMVVHVATASTRGVMVERLCC